MFGFRTLPWEYGIRNLMRRPLRTALTLLALTTVTLLVLIVIGFVRGLERTLDLTGDPDTVLVFSLGMGENLEYSSIPQRTADLLGASVEGIRERYGRKYASPELFLGTKVQTSLAPERQGSFPASDEASETQESLGLVRGVTPAALLVHHRVEIVSGKWPSPGEILVGRLTETKLGLPPGSLNVGDEIQFEEHTWRISGIFAAAGSTYESELWCRLDDLQQALKRQDLSLVAVSLGPTAQFRDVDLFCKERLDLELQAIQQTEYIAALNQHYGPVRWLSWLVVILVAAAGVFVGLNTMYGAVVGRIREIAALQTIGFSRRAAILSIVQEGTVLAMAGALLASAAGLMIVNGLAVQFTMGAFELAIDGQTLLIGNLTALLLGVGGAIPPAIRIFRLSVVDSLKSV